MSQQQDDEYNSSLKLGEPAAAAVFDQEQDDNGSASDHSRRSREPLSVAKSAELELNHAQIKPKALNKTAGPDNNFPEAPGDIPLADIGGLGLCNVEEANLRTHPPAPVFTNLPVQPDETHTLVRNVDEVNSSSQDPEPVLPTKTVVTKPREGQDAVIQPLRLSPVTAEQQPFTDCKVASVTSSESSPSVGVPGSMFRILEVKDDVDSDLDQDSSKQQPLIGVGSNCQALPTQSALQFDVTSPNTDKPSNGPGSCDGQVNGRANDGTDGRANSILHQAQSQTNSKYPRQVSDSHQRSSEFMKVFQEQQMKEMLNRLKKGNEMNYGDLVKGQLQYIRPGQSKPSVEKIRTVEAEKFPDFNALSSEQRLLIYSTEENLPAGEVYFKPKAEDFENKVLVLGSGGNGKVIKCNLHNKDYAVKKAKYRVNELNIWSVLHHPNIQPLLGVMIGLNPFECYQFMPVMTGDLRFMMSRHGNSLETRLRQMPELADVILDNAVHVFVEIFKGLEYLDSLNIQHGDIKAHNVLVRKECACDDLLTCKCTSKSIIRISDFDTARRTKGCRTPKEIPACSRCMTEDEMEKVKGTLSHRAPEQFKVCPRQSEYEKTSIDGRVYYDMQGPWCDMWSTGVMMVNSLLGATRHQMNIEANKASMLCNVEARGMCCKVEAATASNRLKKVFELQFKQPKLGPLTQVATGCLEDDHGSRLTATQALQILHQQPALS